MKQLKILVVEDEINSFVSIRRCLHEMYPSSVIDGPIKNNASLSEVLSQPYDYDLILSDIHLEDGLCFKALTETKPEVPVIFITAYDEYALTAFKVGGVGYLLKPIDQDDLKVTVDRTLRFCKKNIESLPEVASSFGFTEENTYRHHLIVPVIDGYRQINVADICYFMKEGEKVKMYMATGDQYLMNETLETLEHQLNPTQFFRANRQCIVHRSSIERVCKQLFQKRKIVLKPASHVDIVVSKDKVPKLMAWLQQ